MTTMTALSGAFDTSELPKIAAEPVTVTVSRTVVPGRETDFEAWAETLTARVEHFPGSLGAGVLRPGPDGGPYHVIFRFKDALALREWERSPQRLVLLSKLEGIVEVDETRVQRTVGVDSWFGLPERAEPRRGFVKSVFTDVAWVYPVALTSAFVVAPHLTPLPVQVSTLLSAGLITVVMRGGVGPMRKRLRSRRRFG
jgi:uncharacterized protein